ncbi:MAG: phosphatase PAP2 family protein, partial [Bacteroidia bacterium]|nr:phosphatase PAP2 family protein [Bacteroidia bacterium]
MLSTLENMDRELFVFLNGMNNSVADWLMYYTSEKWVWIPFYLLIVLLLFRTYGVKTLYIILPIVLVITGTDQISVMMKNEIARYRPCHNLELMELVHKVDNHCGGKFGFVSSHSA